jgi:hypothetical protein
LLLDGIQTYFDQALARDEEQVSPYQKSLLDGLPTFNGIKLPETVLPYSDKTMLSREEEEEGGDAGSDLAAWSSEEEDDGEEAPAQPAARLNGAPPHAEAPPISQAKSGRVATIDEINAQFAAAEAETNGWEAAPPPHHVENKPQSASVVVVKAPSPAGSPAKTPPVATPIQQASLPAHTAPAVKLASTDEAPAVATHRPPHTNGKAGVEESKPSAPIVSTDASPNREEAQSPTPPVAANPPPRSAESKPPASSAVPSTPPSAPSVEANKMDHRPATSGRQLHITLRRSGNLERDKFRLKEIYDFLRDPRGRDQFFIRLELNGQAHQLAFPNDLCSVSERLLQELKKHFRVEVAVEGQ